MSTVDLFPGPVAGIVHSLESALDQLDPDSLERLKVSVADAPTFELREFMALQFAAGHMTHEVAQPLYAIAERWANATTAERVTWVQFCGTLAKVYRPQAGA